MRENKRVSERERESERKLMRNCAYVCEGKRGERPLMRDGVCAWVSDFKKRRKDK